MDSERGLLQLYCWSVFTVDAYVGWLRSLCQLWITCGNYFYFTAWKLQRGALSAGDTLGHQVALILIIRGRSNPAAADRRDKCARPNISSFIISDKVTCRDLFRYHCDFVVPLKKVIRTQCLKVIGEYPCHFPKPHLNFPSLGSSCRHMLIRPFTQMFPLNLRTITSCTNQIPFYLLPSDLLP